MDIHIKTVPNEEIKQRAGFTGADWWFDENGNIEVRVAELGDWREEFALALHEASEAGFCKYLGISQDDVDRFDFEYKQTHEIDLNAGDETFAPYKVPHTFSTAIERIATGVMNVDWKKYDDKLSVI